MRYKNFTRRVAVVTLLLYKKIVVIVAKELTDDDRDRLNRGGRARYSKRAITTKCCNSLVARWPSASL
jgi:hypothetical protein